jgi:hypothetical protein
MLTETLSCDVYYLCFHCDFNELKYLNRFIQNTNLSAIQLHLSIVILNVLKTITNCFSQPKKPAKDRTDCLLVYQSSCKPQVPLLSHSFLLHNIERKFWVSPTFSVCEQKEYCSFLFLLMLCLMCTYNTDVNIE